MVDTPHNGPAAPGANKPAAYWQNQFEGWFSYRYPYTNSVPHKLKLLRYPPDGNVDDWVDNGPPEARPQP